MFTRTDDTGWQQSTAFKKAFSMDVDIEFIGVWCVLHFLASVVSLIRGMVFHRDTVASVGIIPRTLPFTASNSAIRIFRHAVSLDEHRAKFKANMWNRTTAKESEWGTRKGEMPKAGKSVGGGTIASDTANDKINPTSDNKPAAEKTNEVPKRNKTNTRHAKPRRKNFRVFEDAFDAAGTRTHETDVLEVWFAGCHTGSCLALYTITLLDFLVIVPASFDKLIYLSHPRRRGRLCRELQPAQPRPHSPPLDDPPVLPCQHRHPLPRASLGRDRD
jgi:T6SS, Phospholipase effector Tle1-like, catalytic domain